MLHTFNIHLKAYHPAMEYAWGSYFDSIEEVTISSGDILREKADAIVSAANSFGYMDGGLDLLYSQHFGWELERRLRDLLVREHDGELPVGQGVIVETGNEDIPYMISAPTMRVPMNIADTVNVYWAFRGVIRAVREHNNRNPGNPIRSVLCPALGTGEGRMPYERCAWQMYNAYAACMLGRIETMGGLAGAVRNHMSLLE